jgi:hypothetical protein
VICWSTLFKLVYLGQFWTKWVAGIVYSDVVVHPIQFYRQKTHTRNILIRARRVCICTCQFGHITRAHSHLACVVLVLHHHCATHRRPLQMAHKLSAEELNHVNPLLCTSFLRLIHPSRKLLCMWLHVCLKGFAWKICRRLSWPLMGSICPSLELWLPWANL